MPITAFFRKTNGKEGAPLGGHSHFSLCCGAQYSVLKNPARIGPNLPKGIRVIDGIQTPEMDNGFVKVDHVKTRNGDITVAVQYNV